MTQKTEKILINSFELLNGPEIIEWNGIIFELLNESK